MFDLAKDFRSILPKLSDQTLQHVHDELKIYPYHPVKKILRDIEMEQHSRSVN